MPHPFALRVVIPVAWTLWGIYWVASSFNVKRAQWRDPAMSQLWYRVPIIIGWVLLLNPNLFPPLKQRLLPESVALADLGGLLVVAGLGLAIVARWHLGGNWSSTVTVKDAHTLIRSGPYRYIRHPIYTGLALALLGLIVALGDWRTVIATVVVVGSFVRKLAVEERAMRSAFPEYGEYARDTWALLPFLY